MKENTESIAKEIKFKLSLEAPASSTEMDTFWKKLRHFYRTGEKQIKDDAASCTSVFRHIMEVDENIYPHFPEGWQKEIALGRNTAYELLDHLLKVLKKDRRRMFGNKLQEVITGLNKLLNVDVTPDKGDQMENTYDFASEMIAFNKLAEIIPGKSRSVAKLSENRMERLHKALEILSEGMKYFQGKTSRIIADKKIQKQVLNDELFGKSEFINMDSKDPFMQLDSLFREEMESFSELMRAFRIATLDVEDSYIPNVHDEYFGHFTWHRLFDEELELFRPHVLIISHEEVLKHLASFSKLMSGNQPVRIIVYRQGLVSELRNDISWEDAANEFRQELSALAVAHRNVYTFQSSLDDPQYVYKGLKQAFECSTPSISEILWPSDTIDNQRDELIFLKSCSAGRYFPKLTYDPMSGTGGDFDISANPEPGKDWPEFSIMAETSGGREENLNLAFTYADYKAIFKSKSKELMLVPAIFNNEFLVPINQYLSLKGEALYGKIPFVWLVNKQNELQRAAVPNLWAVSCQERLDFWNYLQRMAGISKKESKSGEVVHATGENGSTKEVFSDERLAQIQENAVKIAVERMLQGLLGEDVSAELEDLKVEMKMPTAEPEKKAVVSDKEEPAVKSEAGAEAYVDTADCTSCNECVDQFPNLFKYNDDKQAYLTDAKNGTFEQLVKAAEKCPAMCIHPGEPVNPNEANIEKLKKRAEKFN